MLSVIIPSRKERFLEPTVRDVLAKAAAPIEVVVVLDGYWPDPPLPADKRIVQLHFGQARGMRPAINAAADVAKGEYLMKLDAHCMVAEGFDEVLKADCDEDWVVVPRRKRLDAENWCIQDVGKPDIDSMYLSFPDDPNDRGGGGLHGRIWTRRILDRSGVLIDEDMSAQGSGWFMSRKCFGALELFDHESYGTFGCEFQEIGLKAWLSGGKVMRNKKTWYAHLHKGRKYGRGYKLDRRDWDQATKHTNRWITNDAWTKQTLPFDWLIDHFWPIPTWPENWREALNYK